MSERETKKYIATNGLEVVHYTSATGGDVMDLEVAAANNGTMDKSGSINVKLGDAHANRLRKIADIMIVSIGEITDKAKIWEALRAMPANDYNTIMLALNSALNGLAESEGKA